MKTQLPTTRYIWGFTWVQDVRVILRGGKSYYGMNDEQTVEENDQDAHDTRDWAGDDNWSNPQKWEVLDDVEPEVGVWPGGYWEGWS